MKDGVFEQSKPTPKPDIQPSFTTIQPQESLPPESGELDLSQFEGRAVMIQGMYKGEWVYSAEVIDSAGPIFTAVVEKLFLPLDKDG